MTFRIAAFIAAIFLITPCFAHEQIVGHWIGTARVVHLWAYGKTFQVALDVHRNGSVTGKLGAAKLIDGHWRTDRPSDAKRTKNRDWMDYMITGRLSGMVIPADHIAAANVFIPLDTEGGKLQGGVNTHGTTHRTFFGTDQMGIMSCDLTLERFPTARRG